MKVLVTGAAGKVGSRLIPALKNSGHDVTGMVQDATGDAAKALTASGATVVEGDILRPDTLQPAINDKDVVVHLAAFFRSTDAELIQRTNVEGTKNVAESILHTNKNIRLIFPSTGMVYDSKAGPAKESDEVAPTMPYPASKVQAEQYLLEQHNQHGLRVCIFRFAFVYGAGDPHLDEASPLFERWHMHPAQRMHLLHHADIAQAMHLVMQMPNTDGQIYNLGDDAPLTVQEILGLSGNTANLPDPSTPLDKPWGGLVDTSKIRQLGFRPLVSSLYVAKDLGIS
jgi:nucleoside-diphosphate-sugar epimerase